MFFVTAALLLSASVAVADTTMQKWTPGWDNSAEPLNYAKSNITWSVNAATRILTATFTLVGARPGKLYQVGMTFFCTTFPATFGQFLTDRGVPGDCNKIIRRNVTEFEQAVELGVVTTDMKGDGSFTIAVGPVASGNYEVEFMVRDGAGCKLSGGGGDGSDCNVDFQSPGPFRTAAKIIVP